VRAGLEELPSQPGDVAVDEHPLPRDQHVAEHHQRVGLVIAGGQRVVIAAARGRRVRAPAVELQAGRGHRDGEADGEVAVLGGERLDAGDKDLVGDRGAGGQHQRAADHEAVRAFCGHAGLDELAVPAVRGGGPGDLRRDERGGHEQAFPQQPAVIADHVRGQVMRFGGERLRVRGEPGQEGADVIRAAPDPAVGVPGPGPDRTAAGGQVGLAARDRVGQVGLLARFRRGIGHGGGRVGGQVEQLGHRGGDRRECRVAGHVAGPLPVDVYLPVVLECGQVVSSGAHHTLLRFTLTGMRQGARSPCRRPMVRPAQTLFIHEPYGRKPDDTVHFGWTARSMRST
jgi:hypothetical protein